MLYRILRACLFRLDPETAHDLSLRLLSLPGAAPAWRLAGPRVPPAPRVVMGIEFPNPVGLAAGFDKDGHCVDALLALGFGFVEIGTVTPRPQPGNPRPRMFRLVESAALINRMGFNNLGVQALLTRLERTPPPGVLGINIGKNRDTPLERAADDYRQALQKVYRFADYVTINISSPNTPALRKLQFGAALEKLLASLKADQARLCDLHGRYVPLAVKVSPDLSASDIGTLAATFRAQSVDCVIATNTTTSRPGLDSTVTSREQGGLSGSPLVCAASDALRGLVHHLQGEIPVIAVGGIMCAEDAMERLHMGASLVQLYTGLIYRGPTLIREIVNAVVDAQFSSGEPMTASKAFNSGRRNVSGRTPTAGAL